MRHAYQPGLGGEVWLGFRLVGGAEVSINKNVALWLHAAAASLASFPGSHAPEREIEVVQAWRAWYFLSREKRQR